MHAGIAPLLLRGTGPVPCTPGRHTAIVGFPQKAFWHAGS